MAWNIITSILYLIYFDNKTKDSYGYHVLSKQLRAHGFWFSNLYEVLDKELAWMQNPWANLKLHGYEAIKFENYYFEPKNGMPLSLMENTQQNKVNLNNDDLKKLRMFR